jgi:4-hydroxy-4-methyl-2-oxoglutarate aldolase
MKTTPRYSSSTIYEAAGRKGALPSTIKPLAERLPVEGHAFTVRTAPGDNIWLHRALARAEEGDVLVVATGDERGEQAYWGDVMTLAAQSRGILGLVIDGQVRDGAEIVRMGFPVFARGLCMRGPTKSAKAPGSLLEPITIGEVTIRPGDLVVGDGDGVVVVAREQEETALQKAKEREDGEAVIRERLRNGETTLEIYGLE